MNNIPYQFLGYKLLQASYNRDLDTPIEKFSLKMEKTEYLEQEQIYNCLILVNIQFKDCKPSSFMFLTGYKILNTDAFFNLDGLNQKSLLFSIAFPFIREKVNNICNDSRDGFIMPILDLRNVNIEEGITFINNH